MHSWSRTARGTSRGRRHLRLAAAGGALLVLASGCRILADPEPTFSGPADAEHHVVIASDSILYQTEHNPNNAGVPDPDAAITSSLQALGFRTNRAQQIGAKISEATMGGDPAFPDNKPFPGWPAIPATTSTGDDTELIAVTELSTNDLHTAWQEAGGVFDQAAFDRIVAFYDQYVAETGADCNVFVGVIERDPDPAVAESWGMSTYGPPMNTYLRAKAQQTGGVFLDMAAVYDAHPEYFFQGGVHFSEAGKLAFVGYVLDEVDACAAIVEAADAP